jgi:hypothetical protein
LSTTWLTHRTFRVAAVPVLSTSKEFVSWNILALSRSSSGRSRAAERMCDVSMLSKRTSRGKTRLGRVDRIKSIYYGSHQVW